ncbi:hypothetical protein [Albimonas pacifica]|uniref:Uncharacterized protein n=1 Tax=Albimonas pacifica TaxID=1114924 RepID=A0A1I3JI28_9RHOB|nr:hypothetical protein [Albimonas pacifica]SFI59899.1 hypothetical protein SAMN05216258_10817 [Albimonas pacifica]
MNTHLLERCHAALCDQLGQLLARQDQIRAEHQMMAASGVYALPTELDAAPQLQRLRRLILDVEAELGRRPPGTDPWIGSVIDDRRAA